MATNPQPNAPLRRIGMVLLAAVVGIAAGVGAVAFMARHSEPSRRAATPSVTRFRFPTRGPIAATAAVAATAQSADPASGRAVVEAFLDAERASDGAAAYGLLAAADRESVGSVSAWSEGRADRPAPATFQVTAEQVMPDGDDVTVAVTRPPSLDPFVGFVSGRATQVWRAVREDSVWRVQAEPVSEMPVLPAASTAAAPVGQWVQALASCDRNRARTFESAPNVYGSLDLLALPCHERGAWSAGVPVTLDRATDIQPIVEAYGADVGAWARLVPVRGPHSHFFAAVAPLGDDWRVIGITSDGG